MKNVRHSSDNRVYTDVNEAIWSIVESNGDVY